jgi:hypothetical protein
MSRTVVLFLEVAMQLSESDMHVARRRAMWKLGLLLVIGLVLAALTDELLRRTIHAWAARELVRYALMAVLLAHVLFVGLRCLRWYRAYEHQKRPRWLYLLMCINVVAIGFVPSLFVFQFRWF